MTERELITKLKALRAIEPDAGYVRTSRYLILSGEETKQQPLGQGIFSRGINFTFSVALTAVFLIALTFGGMTNYFKTLLLPSFQGVGNNGLVTEADTITNDINIRLDDIEYFDNSVALIDTPNLPVTKSQAGSEDEIDKLLEEVISY